MTVLDTAGNGGWRDYLQGRLHKKLTAGKRYCVTFYVSLAEGSHQAIADISAYLDNGSIDTTKTCSAAQTKYIPQVTNASGIISDTANWVKIEGSFISNGTEQFITIGNFKDNAHTLSVNMPTTAYSGSVEGSFYSIDDVSVVESDLKADAGPDRHIGNGDSTYIGRPKEVGLECTWFVLGSSTAIGTGAGIWVKPAVSTSYIVTQTLCGGTKKDTVRVEVWAVGVKGIEGKNEQRYSLSPNPNNGTFVLTQSMIVNQTTNTEVYDMLGRSIFNTTVRFRDGKTVLTLKDIDPGIYLLKMGERTDASLRFEVR